MTAVPLFDIFSSHRNGTPEIGDRTDADRILSLTSQLIDSALSDYQHLRKYEDDFSPGDWSDVSRAMEIERSIYAMIQQWSKEAAEVLSRVRPIASTGDLKAKFERLQDAFYFTQARLKMTPEDTAHVMEQVKRGEFIPLKEARDELNARLRA